MRKIIICLLVTLFMCACTNLNGNSELQKESSASQIVEFTQENGETTSQLDISPDEKDDLADEKTQFIVVTYNNLEPPDTKNYIYLCDIHASCSCIFETTDTISSISDLRFGPKSILIVSIFDGININLRVVNIDNSDDSIEIDGSGYSYFLDSRGSTILFKNQQVGGTTSPRIFTLDLEDLKKEEIYIPCEVHWARFGVNLDEIYFNGFCNSVKAFYLFDTKTKTTNTILDLPVDQFSISPDKSKIAYNYFTNTPHLELFLPVESRKVTNDKLSTTTNFFTMWVDADRLLFAQKFKGNEGEFFLWNFTNNTISKADVPHDPSALSRYLDFAVTHSDSNGLSIVNMQTNSFTTIDLPSDQSSNMVYFLGTNR